MTKKSSESADDPNNTRDKFTGFYTILTLVVSILELCSGYINNLMPNYTPAILQFFLFQLLLFLWVAIMLTGLFKSIFRRRWRRVISIVVAPIIVGFFWWTFLSFGLPLDKIRFECTKSIYLREVQNSKAIGGLPHLMAWDWGQDVFPADSITFDVLVYDDSDQIALPLKSRSAEWLQAADKIMLPDKWVLVNLDSEVQSLGGHFYIVTGRG